MFKRYISVILASLLFSSIVVNAEETETIYNKSSVSYNPLVEFNDVENILTSLENNITPYNGQAQVVIQVNPDSVAITNVNSELWVKDISPIMEYNEGKGGWLVSIYGILENNSMYDSIEIQDKSIEIYNKDFSKQYNLLSENLYSEPLFFSHGNEGCIYSKSPMFILDFTNNEISEGFNIVLSWTELYEGKPSVYLDNVMGDITYNTNEENKRYFKEYYVDINVYNNTEKDYDYADVYYIWYGLDANGNLIIKDIETDLLSDMLAGTNKQARGFYTPHQEDTDPPVKVVCYTCGVNMYQG